MLGPYQLLANDSIYIGEWKDGQQTGKGKKIWKDGAIYEGYWTNNMA
jgi:hypothetical protein